MSGEFFNGFFGIEPKTKGLLVGSGQETESLSLLKGKVIGLYFSAHWCPPCRAFTPELAKWYNKFKADSPHREKFELVFCSFDKTRAEFDEYRSEMPFPALSFNLKDLIKELSSKCQVMGIPALVVISPQGEVLSYGGRALTSKDPTSDEQPWLSLPKEAPAPPKWSLPMLFMLIAIFFALFALRS
eukprot:m.357337 g.357337  ORF g.357337 m.357337 type:complete len:186 (-) comp17798_c0_seq1:226-783(-)